MLSSKRGVSLMVAYVLLIVIAVALSILVYGYLVLYAPSAGVECPADLSLGVQSYSCNNNTGLLTVELKNNGLFNISGAYVRFGESGRRTRSLLNDKEIFPQGTLFATPLAPSKLAAPASFSISSLFSQGKSYVLEVQPAIFEENSLVPCKNAVVSIPLSCGPVSGGPSCVPSAEICTGGIDEDCDGLIDCDDNACAEDNACAPSCVPVAEICSNEEDEDCDGLIDCDDVDSCGNDPVCDPWNGFTTDHWTIDPGPPPATPDPDTIYLGMNREECGFSEGCFDNIKYYTGDGYFVDWEAGFAIGYDSANNDLYIVGAGKGDGINDFNHSLFTIKLDAATFQPLGHSISHQVIEGYAGSEYQCSSELFPPEGYYPPETPVDIYKGRWAGSLQGAMSFRVESIPHVCYLDNWQAYRFSGSGDMDGYTSRIYDFTISDSPIKGAQVGEWLVTPGSPTSLYRASLLRKDHSYGSAVWDSSSPVGFYFKSFPYPNIAEPYDWSGNELHAFTGPSANIGGIPLSMRITREVASSDNAKDEILVNGNLFRVLDYSGRTAYEDFKEAYTSSGMVAGRIWAVEGRVPSSVSAFDDPAIYFIGLNESDDPFMVDVETLTTGSGFEGMWKPYPGHEGSFMTKPILLRNNAGGFMITYTGDDRYPGGGFTLPAQNVTFFRWKNPGSLNEGLIPSGFSLTADFDEIGTGFAHVSATDTIYIVTRSGDNRDGWYGLLDLYVISKN